MYEMKLGGTVAKNNFYYYYLYLSHQAHHNEMRGSAGFSRLYLKII